MSGKIWSEGDEIDMASLLMKNGFKETECTEEEYYDKYGRYHEMPYYKSAKCYQKEYEWGTATVRSSHLDLDEVIVYLDVKNFPPIIVERIIDGSTDYKELDDAYADLVDASYHYEKADLSFYPDSVPVDHNLELSCKRDELISCIENISSWINDYIKYLEEKAEELLRKYKPDELNDVKCPKCGIIMKKYELEYHLEQHEFEEAKEQFYKIKKMVEDAYKIPDKSEYQLAFKYFEKDIKDLLKIKILPLYKGLADEINKRISEEVEKRGVLHLNLKQFLYHFMDILELIIKNVPKEIRKEFILEYTSIPTVLSSSALDKFINLIESDTTIQEIRNPHFTIKLKKKRGMCYVHIYVNEEPIAYLKVDDKIKDKIRNKIAEHLIDPTEIERITEELFRAINACKERG